MAKHIRTKGASSKGRNKKRSVPKRKTKGKKKK